MSKKRKADTAPQASPAADIAPLLRQAELRDLRLLACSCTIGETAQRPVEIKQSIQVHCSPKSDAPKVLAMRAAFSLVGSNSDGLDGFRIEASYRVLYGVESPADFTPDQITAFGQVLGLNDVWPFWREFVQSVTARMGFPPLTLPILRPAQMQFTPIAAGRGPKTAKRKHPAKTKK